MPQSTIDLAEKQFLIVGHKGSGKTTLAKHILNQTAPDDHLVYDPLGEYVGYRRYVPKDRRDPEEADAFIREIALPYRPKLLLFDEGNAYTRPKPARLEPYMQHLVDFSRHEGIAFGVIARRPVQLHSDLVELANFYFVFNLHGTNDIKRLNETYAGMGQAVRGLKLHYFAILAEGRELTIHAPIPYGDENLGVISPERI